MRCPFCSAEDTQVKDSRPSDDKSSIKRRRTCPICNHRFTTIERIQIKDLMVIKRDGVKQVFDRDKITRAIKTALRKRSVSEEKIDYMVNNLVYQFESLNDAEIPTALIGEAIMRELLLIDQVAYVRFASVYQDFNTAADFEKFIHESGITGGQGRNRTDA